mgnify:CR=1 FL=1
MGSKQEMFKDCEHKIYIILEDEYRSWCYKHNKHYPEYINTIDDWCDFIHTKQLGVQCMGTGHDYWGYYTYQVVDANQWLLTKIRYGIV